VGFHSFWNVYNQVRDAVDSDFLFRSSIGAIDEENGSEDSELGACQRPLQHLQPCEFGGNGIPPMQHEGETALVTSFLPIIPLICCLPAEEPDYSARLSEGAPGMIVSKLGFHTSVDLFWKMISWLSSQMMRQTRFFDYSEEPSTCWCHVHIPIRRCRLSLICDHVI